jgi:1,4-alpha-glucan branching enzyme
MESKMGEIHYATQYDLYLFGEGHHQMAWEFLGAHFGQYEGREAVHFGVWAPAARSVSVVGDFNGWKVDRDPMSEKGFSGVWETISYDCRPGDNYKFSIETQDGTRIEKADPYAFWTEAPPKTASKVLETLEFAWTDSEYLGARPSWIGDGPVSIYEVHLGSFMLGAYDKTYEQAADFLVRHVLELGFTHVELMPINEHPYGGSWGYQGTSYFAPSARWGTPLEFAYLVDTMHRAGVGVILDWVPGHFATDAHGLFRFDGTALYEHLDEIQGIHPDWGSAVFNFDRTEVRSFLLSSANFWIQKYHIDALRVDAVASMIYLDYSRTKWVPNIHGGRENLGAISLLQEVNEMVPNVSRGAATFAEESTAFPNVTKDIKLGGLGFGFKWNMGWMHDTLSYLSLDPIYRRYHHDLITFGLLYAFSENFVLPLSHDEVVHQKGSLYGKMFGDHWQRFAHLRALYAWMWAYPGKKLLFMGSEAGQEWEWNDESLPDIGSSELGIKLKLLVSDLNAIYRSSPQLFKGDHSPSGFSWVVVDDKDSNVFAFSRAIDEEEAEILCVANFSMADRENYLVPVRSEGWWLEILNSDSEYYGGSGKGNLGQVQTNKGEGDRAYLSLYLPSLTVILLSGNVKKSS